MGTFDSAKVFPYTVENLEPVAQDVMTHFQERDFDVTGSPIPTGGQFVSINKGGMFKAVAGMRTGLNIELVPMANGTQVSAKAGIFGRQAVAGTVTLLVFWPLIIPQIWGMAQNSGLDEEALNVAEDSLKRHSG